MRMHCPSEQSRWRLLYGIESSPRRQSCRSANGGRSPISEWGRSPVDKLSYEIVNLCLPVIPRPASEDWC